MQSERCSARLAVDWVARHSARWRLPPCRTPSWHGTEGSSSASSMARRNGEPRAGHGSTEKLRNWLFAWPRRIGPGAMIGLWGRWPIWGMRSRIKRSAMFCNATVYRPRRSASTRPPGGAGGDRLLHGGGPHAARTGDLLRAVFIHPESRKVDIAGITVHPNERWMQQ